MRSAVRVVLIVLILGVGYARPPRLPLYRSDASFRVHPLAMPAVRQNGRLTWLGGVRLSSTDPAFGGFSALAVRGDRFTLLSDAGNLLRFRMGPDWRPFAARFGELPDGPGAGWDKRDRDSESLTLAPDGRAWVGFERANAIWRYDPGFARAQGHVEPRVMRDWDSNGGAESLVRLRDGRFLVLAETSRTPGRPGRAAALFPADPVADAAPPIRFTYRPDRGHRASDAAQLPNGDVLVLEREWRLPLRFRFRLALLRLADIRPGVVVRGRTLGRIVPPWPIDNYEGLAITREGGATILWLVTDDDQTWWRRSYLIKLRLD